jgi:hypothetical protein
MNLYFNIHHASQELGSQEQLLAQAGVPWEVTAGAWPRHPQALEAASSVVGWGTGKGKERDRHLPDEA